MSRELHHAIRALRSWRFGAAAAVAKLAVGIGTATSMYALVRMALSTTIPDVEAMDTLARIHASSRTLGVERSQLMLKDLDLLVTASSFESVEAYSSDDETEITANGQPVKISIGEVSSGFFTAMRAHAGAGQLLSADDFRKSAEVVVVSDRLWRKYLPVDRLARRCSWSTEAQDDRGRPTAEFRLLLHRH